MYLSHYNLREKPFQITADPKFLWLGEKHQEALATLKYGVLDNKGFLLLTGDVGTGKTTLINALLRDLDNDTIVATVVDPDLKRLEFFNLLADAFEIKGKFTRKVDFLTGFERFLNNAYSHGRRILLIIDEAQKLSTELLEEIRLLSNIEKENRKLLNTFFVGQNELNKILMEKGCRALRQRIAITHKIEPLTEGETGEYVQYRLKVAGTNKEIFNRKAIRQIYVFSDGYPRLINTICDHALLTGYVRDAKSINAAIVKECAKELTLPGETVPTQLEEQMPKGKKETRSLLRPALYASLVLLITVFGYLFSTVGYDGFLENTKNYYRQIFGQVERSSPTNEAGNNEQYSQKSWNGQYTGFPIPREKTSRNAAGESQASEPIEPPASATFSETEVHDIQSLSPSPPNNRTGTLEHGKGNKTYVAKIDTPTRKGADKGTSERGMTNATRPNATSERESFWLSTDSNLVVPFNFDTNELRATAYDNLDRLAGAMVQNPDIKIAVKGYTDTLGNRHYNKKLSQFRAHIVKSYLVAKGISPLRIEAIGMGEENPLQSNATVAGRAANRRVEIELQTSSGP